MTRRGRLVLALGVVVYAAAWVFGSKPLYPVALGLLLAAVAARLWVGLAHRPLHVRRLWDEHDVLEGADVEVRLEAEPRGRILPPVLTARERLGRFGEREVELRRLHGSYTLRGLPRGRYAFDPVELTLEDPFGLARAALHEGEPGALLVYPRLVELDRVFAEGGSHTQDGRRLLLRRPSGFDLHSVREYEQGESLRKVHWRTTARRGQLMVKELEDAPRDEIAVLLDGEVAAGFDLAVRAAGSILRSYVRRGRRCVLVVNSALREVQAVHSEATEWRRALELLAAVEPTAAAPASALLSAESSPAARALELVVVTARPAPALVDRLVQRILSRRGAALVHVEASGKPEAGLLRLQAMGVPVAVVREGEDLVAALASTRGRSVA
ncbi:MAG: DUF58 domain-containing protein [Actinobacteria bacterium]|nr:MAG: DUF58 domain-containing protein [Actinomycetota bacterium]